MTSKQYIDTIKEKYPDTYIGIITYLINIFPPDRLLIKKFETYPLDIIISYFIRYIEYRKVNFLEALCNTAIDNVADSHELLRMKTVTNIIYRLEKRITPVEGLPF